MTERPTNDQPTTSEAPADRDARSLDALRGAVLAAGERIGGSSTDAAGDAVEGGGRGGITLERPPRADFGDYSTNAALLLAPRLKSSPREVAERLGDALQATLGDGLQRFEVAGPGFVNLFLADDWLLDALVGVLDAGERFGAGTAQRPEHTLVEFVSANPTGPMHVGHARNAAYGDALARMLEFDGHRVEREFYVNDAGSQVRKLGETIQALARGEPAPEGGYQGEYVSELVASLADAAQLEPAELGRAAVAVMIGQIQQSLNDFHVKGFDHWTYESALHADDPSLVDRTLARLQELGHAYRSEGALWLRTTEFGDDKDRVLVRSNGEHTYFASDIAYHELKRERGFQRQINVWGADHHGYVLRLKAAYQALGGDPTELELLIMQLVHLMRSGERAQMSKRAGEFVTLDDLVAEIGVDAARWYLLARSHDTTVDLDLDLASSQSSENPVYYVQYAHARIVSVLAKAGAAEAQDRAAFAGREPLHPSERELIKQLLAFTPELRGAIERRAPHRIAAYALELAQGFTAFYRDCPVAGAEPQSLRSSRIALCIASRHAIARCLDLLGVSAPQQM